MVAWGFDGAHGTDIRPPHVPATMPWAKDESVPGGNDGTRLTAALVNRLIGNIRGLALAADVTLTEDSDADLTTAISALIGLVAPAAHEHDDRYYLESEVDALLAGLQEIGQKGLANGYAGLDGSGKVPTAQLPDAVLGAMAFQTLWNASTNTPALTSGAGTKGHYYIVDADGTTALNGISDWKVGDWAVYDGTAWRKIDNTDAIAAVAGLTGNISAASLKTALEITVADITNASANGRSLISAADYTAMRTLLAVVATADIVNNLTTNDALKPLSAAQGKALKDQFDAFSASSIWSSQPIGVPIPVASNHFASLSAALPPTDNPAFRYVLLTAGEADSGEYNEGILTSESVSGSAPLVQATGVVSLSGSLLNGKTIRLINTERRFLRAGSVGTVENDQMQKITGSVGFNRTAVANVDGAIIVGGTPGSSAAASGALATGSFAIDSSASPSARASSTTDGETRSKNIGMTYIMRLK